MICVLLLAVLTGCSDEYDYYDGQDGYYGDDYCYEEDGDYVDDYYYDEDCDYENDGYYGEDGYYEEDYYETYMPENTNLSRQDYPLGTCGELEGTTIVASIYLNDANTSWEDNDAQVIYDGLKSIEIATDWIEKSVATYGCNSKFIYDWSNNEDLYYAGTVDVDMLDVDKSGDDLDYATWQFIDDNIDSKALLQKYDADNIVYLFFINTPKSSDVTSCTRNYYEDMPYPYEMCYMYMFCDGEEEVPAAFAHEILHTFGAPDLYREDTYGDNYGVSKELINELERSASNDIMYTTYDAYSQAAHYDKITNDFTDVDAYYVGLIDSCDFVNEWGLGASQH